MTEIRLNSIIDGNSLYADKEFVHVCAIMANNVVINEPNGKPAV